MIFDIFKLSISYIHLKFHKFYFLLHFSSRSTIIISIPFRPICKVCNRDSHIYIPVQLSNFTNLNRFFKSITTQINIISIIKYVCVVGISITILVLYLHFSDLPHALPYSLNSNWVDLNRCLNDISILYLFI